MTPFVCCQTHAMSSMAFMRLHNFMTYSHVQVGSQEPTHRKVGSKSHPTSKGFLRRVGPSGSNARRIARRWLFVYSKTCYELTIT